MSSDNLVKNPLAGQMYGVPGYGYPGMMPGMMPGGNGIAPNIATPTSNFMYPGYNPWFDGKNAHQLTTNPYVNYLGDATNMTQNNIDMLAQFSNMQSGTDPNISFYNNFLAGGLTKMSGVYNQAMQGTEKKSH